MRFIGLVPWLETWGLGPGRGAGPFVTVIAGKSSEAVPAYSPWARELPGDPSVGCCIQQVTRHGACNHSDGPNVGKRPGGKGDVGVSWGRYAASYPKSGDGIYDIYDIYDDLRGTWGRGEPLREGGGGESFLSYR